MTDGSRAPGPAATARAGSESALLLAGLWMLGAIASFSMMAVAGRELATDQNTFQILFWRSLVGLAVVTLALSFTRRGFQQIATRRPGLHTVRNLGHFFGQNCWFYAVATIPLAQVFALEFLTPIWVALLSPLLLGEAFTRWRAVAAALGFAGVLFVANAFAGEATAGAGASGFGLGHIMALAASIGFAINYMATKRLSATESVWNILFWMTASQAVMAALCDVAVSGGDALPLPTTEAAIWLIVVGLCGLGAHFSLTSAVRHADATVVAPMDFFRLPLIAVVGMALYDEPIQLLVFAGGGLIFLGNFFNLRAERRRLSALTAGAAQ